MIVSIIVYINLILACQLYLLIMIKHCNNTTSVLPSCSLVAVPVASRAAAVLHAHSTGNSPLATIIIYSLSIDHLLQYPAIDKLYCCTVTVVNYLFFPYYVPNN